MAATERRPTETRVRQVPRGVTRARRDFRLCAAHPLAQPHNLGRIWARTTGNVFLMVRRIDHDVGMSGQMKNAL